MKKHSSKHDSLSSTDVELCTTICVDLTKQVFQLAGEDAAGRVIYEDRIKSRQAFHDFLLKLPVTVTVLMISQTIAASCAGYPALGARRRQSDWLIGICG
ncbi:hypothetical protein BR1R5_48430 [Pseudomonas sp. BR1R-5]|uniref:ISPpu11, transposase n=1 Tax=Pseudomonas putida TaxID=303 RepID=A0A379KHM7_PSEPU|nr:hypothetical protein [Pseudomonas sp. M2]GLH35454.1 hypothetical protein BR1R5_48430 [Pseudomonas sp. BR1R-5]SUD67495.1 ISPpu11, transposase [Pseudomonas putida]